MDIELGINIIDLGLVYDIQVSIDAINIVMTLTTPACPANQSMTAQIEQILRERFPKIKTVTVSVVWDPPWSPDLMASSAREKLGWV